MSKPSSNSRRVMLLGGAVAGWGLAGPLLAQSDKPSAPRLPLPSMTEGPFYPSLRWRQSDRNQADWDADLTRVTRGKESFTALGEHLDLQLAVVDTAGRLIDGAEVEIWQCDTRAVYQHPSVRNAQQTMDPGFQGFGAATSAKDGQVRFRTIKPVPYPGRTPHIHVKLRHVSFGELTSQLFVSDDPGNARDFIWRNLSASARDAVAMQLRPATGADGLRWQTRQQLVVPA